MLHRTGGIITNPGLEQIAKNIERAGPGGRAAQKVEQKLGR
jgi:hypothetical protein